MKLSTLIKIGLFYDAILLVLLIAFVVQGWYVAAGICSLGLGIDLIAITIYFFKRRSLAK